MTEKRRLRLVDTTLRDGEQRAGLAFSVEQKIACALLMDQAGVDQIEAGIPAMCEEERAAIAAILRRRARARIATWNRMNESDIRASLSLGPDIIHIAVPVSDIQIRTKLRRTHEFVAEGMKRCIALAQSGGAEVSVGFEDASRGDLLFMTGLVRTAVSMGVPRIRYADTVGVAYPSKIQREAGALCGAGAVLECHAHDDLGMAVANSLQAAVSGAEYVDTTFFGIGERAGNCDFARFIRAARPVFSLGVPESGEVLAELESRILTILRLRRLGIRQ